MERDPSTAAGARTRLLLLRAPSANRVYTDAAGPLTAHEAVRVLTAHLGTPVTGRERTIAGLPLLELDAEADQAAMVSIAATLSSTFALFVPHPEDDPEIPLLEPVALPPVVRHPSDLETTLKYPGKTNEQFTALMLNLAASLSGHRAGILDGSLTVLDPLCGRGSTLNRALRLGLSPIGAEIDREDVTAYGAFLSTWLRTHRYKHTVRTGRLTLAKKQLGTRLDAELARDKNAQRSGRTQQLTLLGCDTRRVGELLPRRSIDALVADLPYGVQHGSHSSAGWQRAPLEILREALPVWRPLLRRDAGLALAINRHTAPYDAIAQVLREAGFLPVGVEGHYRHRVDRSIDRDIVLAVRDDHPDPACGDDPDPQTEPARPPAPVTGTSPVAGTTPELERTDP